MDINGADFDAQLFSQKLLKEASLSKLLTHEAEIARQIGAIDSDMQTLVYENYNKFIAATDTIKKMRVDFRAMEDEMDALADKMTAIGRSSGDISATLAERRKEIAGLSATHNLLNKLQFLFELPEKLREFVEADEDDEDEEDEDSENDLETGVKHFLRAQRVLEQYQHMESFKGIKADCDEIVVELKARLLRRIDNYHDEELEKRRKRDLGVTVQLLLALNEAPETLSGRYLKASRAKLTGSLDALERQVRLAEGEKSVLENQQRPSDAFEAPMDVLEFVDHGCNNYVSDLCLVMAAYNETFKVDEDKATLTAFVNEMNERFFALLRARMAADKNLDESSLRARALDRFHRRLQAMSRLLPGSEFTRIGLDLVLEAAEMNCRLCLDALKSRFAETLVETRRALAKDEDVNVINERVLSAVSEDVKKQLETLQVFIDPELTFAVKTYFRARYCRQLVREGVFVAFFNHMAEEIASIPPSLLLLLSKTLSDFVRRKTSQRLLALVDEQFFIDDTSGGLTTLSRLNDRLRSASQTALDSYVKSQGAVLSEMLRKSVESRCRDWQTDSVEPRAVRAVMKRVVEEAAEIDARVGRLYEEGVKKPRSDVAMTRLKASSSSQMDTSLASKIRILFDEKIEIFSPVEFFRVSILTGVIKIALKTLLECVRLQTFSRFGFQQMQLDAHYLQLGLWRFVSDENLVTFLLDEVMISAMHRCVDAVPMDFGRVEQLCESL